MLKKAKLLLFALTLVLGLSVGGKALAIDPPVPNDPSIIYVAEGNNGQAIPDIYTIDPPVPNDP